MKGFERRGGGAEDNWAAAKLRPNKSEVSRVVPNSFALLEGSVVLLIDHDEAKIAHRGEYPGAGPDSHAHFASKQGFPMSPAVFLLEAAVEQSNALLEPRLKPVYELWRQGYFGHDNKRRAALLKGRNDELKVHLCLSAPRNAVEEERRKGSLVDVARCSVHCRPLLLSKAVPKAQRGGIRGGDLGAVRAESLFDEAA